MTNIEYEELCIKTEKYEKLIKQYDHILELINYKQKHTYDNNDDTYTKIIMAKYNGTEVKEYIIDNNEEMYNNLQQILTEQSNRIACEIEQL